MKLFVDADYIVYKACAGAESEVDFGDDVILVVSKFSEAYASVKRELNKIKNQFMWDVPEVVLFFSDSSNFRKEIMPAYKGHRNRKKPCGYKRVINALKDEYEVVILPTLEADDSMGIYATKYPGNVIVSPDKDMRQIPGTLYNMDETVNVGEAEGQRWHLIQTLAGDQTDGYSGVPGIGIKRAVALFEDKGYTWKTVVDAFAEKDLGEDIALQNARLAKILTNDDYDWRAKQPILFTPPPIIELTVEQDFKIRRLEDLLPKADKSDIITLFMALQRQNFALANTVSNLVKQWPNHLNTTETTGKSETS